MKQLSKALVIALVVACAVAFMPLLNGQAFAASKPGKVKSLTFTQADTMNADQTYTVTAKWKAGKNAKKYKVIIKENGAKVYSKTVKKSVKSVAYEAGKIGAKYEVSVQSVNGKKKAKAVKKSLTVADKRAEVKSVKIEATSMVVGSTLTAKLDPADAASAATFTWTHVGSTTALGTGATYVAQKSDVDKQIMVTATIAGSAVYQDVILTDTTTGTVIDAQKEAFFAKSTPVVAGVANGAEVVPNSNLGPISGYTVTYEWYVDGARVAGSASTFTATAAQVGKGLTCVVTYAKTGQTEKLTVTVDFGVIAKDIETTYPALAVDKAPAAGATVTAGLYTAADASHVATASATKYAGTSTVAYTWSYPVTGEDGTTVTKTETGETFTYDSAEKLGVTVTLSAVVTPGADNFAGSNSVSLGAVYDTVKAVTISGDAVFGNTLTAVAEGTVGELSPANATFAWTCNGSAVGANAKTLKLDNPEYVNKTIRVQVTTKTDLTGKTSSPVAVDQAEVASVEITEVRAAGTGTTRVFTYTVTDTNGNVYKNTNGAWDAYGLFTPTLWYNATNSKAYDTTAGASYANTYPASITEGTWYGLQIALTENGGKAFKALVEETNDRAEAKQAGAGLSAIDTSKFVIKANGTTLSGTNVTVGDELSVTTTQPMPDGVTPEFHWYLKNKTQGVTDGATYTVPDSNLTLYVYATAEGYADSDAVALTIKKNLAVDVAFGEKYGDKVVVSKVPEGGKVVFMTQNLTTGAWSVPYYANATATGIVEWTIEDTTTINVLDTILWVQIQDLPSAEAAKYNEITPTRTGPGSHKYYYEQSSGKTVQPGDFSAELKSADGTKTLVQSDTVTVSSEQAVASYAWYVDSVKDSNKLAETSDSLALTAAVDTDDVGHNVFVVVTPTANYGGADAAVTLEATYEMVDDTHTWTIQ